MNVTVNVSNKAIGIAQLKRAAGVATNRYRATAHCALAEALTEQFGTRARVESGGHLRLLSQLGTKEIGYLRVSPSVERVLSKVIGEFDNKGTASPFAFEAEVVWS